MAYRRLVDEGERRRRRIRGGKAERSAASPGATSPEPVLAATATPEATEPVPRIAALPGPPRPGPQGTRPPSASPPAPPATDLAGIDRLAMDEALADAHTTPEDRDSERGLRGLIGSGSSQISVTAAMRARDAARPTEQDLADAEANLTIVRRGWTPRETLSDARQVGQTSGPHQPDRPAPAG